MHIVHVTPYYAPAYAFGGVVRAVEGLARMQAGRGHTVTVLTTDALSSTTRLTPLIADALMDGVRVVRVRNAFPWLRGRLNLSSPLAMRGQGALIAAADVLHLHELRTVEALLTVPLAVRAGVPVALSGHGTLTRSTGRSALKQVWDGVLTPHSARHIAAIVGLTQAESADAAALWNDLRLPTPHIASIPNGVTSPPAGLPEAGSAWRMQHRIPPDAVVVLFMGRLHPRKGAHLLTAAFRRAAVRGSHLVIAGPDEGGLAATRVAAGDDPGITFTGYVDGADRLAVLGAADVFVLPAVGEGLPMAVLEALTAGVPVVISAGCHLPEVNTAGAGIVVDGSPAAPPTVEELAAALHDLLTDAGRRAAMSAAGRVLAADRFGWAGVAAAWDAVYAHIGAGGSVHAGQD